MTTYKLTGQGHVIKNGNITIPTVDTPESPNTNPDYLEYAQWLLAGGTPEPADPETAYGYLTCTPAQGLIALYELKGIAEDEIVAMIEAIGDPLVRYRAKIAFNRATDWKIEHPVIQMLAQVKGLTEDDINALFAYAAQVLV